MNFLKKIFGRKEPREVITEKLNQIEVPDHAVYLPELIDEEEHFTLVKDIAQEFIESGQFKGKLIGRKGWFLPNADKKLNDLWSNLERDKINLKDIGELWKINEKRVFIAMEDHAYELNLEEPIFHREGKDVYLISYFKKAWYDILAAYDDDDHEVEFDKLISNARINPDSRDVFETLVKGWLNDTSGRYTLGEDGLIRPKSIIPDMIVELIPQLFEQGQSQVTYEELAEKYGMHRKEIGKILQKLIDDKALGDVTLYVTDEMIKPRL